MATADELGLSIVTAVRAGQPAVLVHTDEVFDAIAEIRKVAAARLLGAASVHRWDADKGLVSYADEAAAMNRTEPVKLAQALSTVLSVKKAQDARTKDSQQDTYSILLVIGGAAVVGTSPIAYNAALLHFCQEARQHFTTVVFLCPPGTKLTPELQPLFQPVQHKLPDEEALTEIVEQVCAGVGDDAPVLDPNVVRAAVHALKGLTRMQAEAVIASSLVKFGNVNVEYVWKQKANTLNQDGLVEVLDTKLKYADVGGNDGVKAFLKKALTPHPLAALNNEIRGKGVLLVGGPGLGKSLIAQTTGNEMGLPTLLANPGNLMGKFVGDTETNTRRFFAICKAMAPVIVVLDEVGKVMPSAKGPSTDSGVGSRLLGTFLTAMNDIKEPVFYVFTENDATVLHEAFTRAERIDGIFYVQLPTEEQRAAIWKIYARKFFPTVTEAQIKSKTDRDAINAMAYEPDIKDLLNDFPRKVDEVTPQQLHKLVLAYLASDKSDRTYAESVLTARTRPGKDAPPDWDWIKQHIPDDHNWSPAEICSCCRLACQLRSTLKDISQTIRPVAVTAKDQLANLEQWAKTSALDSNTGKNYGLVSENTSTPKAKRRVSV